MPKRMTNDEFQNRLRQLRESGFDVYTDDEYVSSNDRMTFYCSKGHKWPAIVTTILNNHSGCPYCCGRLAIVGETFMDNETRYCFVAPQSVRWV